MNVTEFATVVSAIKAAYPSANLMPDKQSKDVWYTMLSDLDYTTCIAAIKVHMSTNKYAPTIAEIRELYADVIIEPLKDWGAAWGEVLRAIRFKGMYREEEALENLEEMTRQCVKQLGYQNLCLSENINQDRANFRMIYEQLDKRRRTEAQLSLPLKEQRQRLRELTNKSIAMLEEGRIENGQTANNANAEG